ncbi:hypothetical protein WMF37_08335 [Sorangium sp. So ce291]|uniref:hypothetical protein n=1 Tax=Sorangium sp. So ce291 TaxID=3133294 RepID=UPI003F636C7A
MLLDLARFALQGRGSVDEGEPRFRMEAHGSAPEQRFHLDWQRAAALGGTFFRIEHTSRT